MEEPTLFHYLVDVWMTTFRTALNNNFSITDAVSEANKAKQLFQAEFSK